MLVVSMLLPTFSIAATKEEQLKNTKQQITDTKNQIKQNEKEQKNVLGEINNLETSINTTENEIESTRKQISTVEGNIKNTEADIQVKQAEYDKNYELRKDRMVAYYKVGSVSLEESVSKIDNEPDRMYMEKAIEKVVAYDTELINMLERQRIALEEKYV